MSSLVLGLVACSTEEPDPMADVPAFPVDAPVVTVLEQGENPQLLEYTYASFESPEANWHTTLEVAGGIDQAVAAEGENVDPEAPAGGDVMTTTLPVTITFPAGPAPEEAADSTRSVRITAGAGKHSDLALGQEVAANEGFMLSWWGDDTGAIDAVKLLPPEESPEAGRQVVEQALLSVMSANVVFPAEPIGVGGSWSVEARTTGDTSMIRTTTYTVRDITDGPDTAVSLDVKVDERPAQQPLRIDNQVAGALDGQTLQVENTSATSDGELTVELNYPLPTSGNVASTTRLTYSGGEGSSFRIVQDVTSGVTFKKEG
ncbi:oxidoreductase [Corynebacterium glaucum]|nr:oxidoreductase [Corynebacterium glaucum]